MATNTKFHAKPTKEFFVEMITRDITLVDCVLDLIDNSVDSVLHKTKFDPYKGLFKEDQNILGDYKISITLSNKEFKISDNAEGIDRKHAEEHVFSFGTKGNLKKELGLSVYGIGMKRSFLKIGKKINLTTVDEDEKTEVFIDVDKWLGQEEWDFNGNYENKKPKDKKGTSITIQDLYKNISANFANEAFEKNLINRIQTVYGVFLKNGLKIKVNGKDTKAKIPALYASSKLKPSIGTFTKEGVKVKIIAGVTKEDEKSLNGWFVFCNGRMILRGDKTEATGWGNGLRKFHPSTNRFFGFVYLESKDVDKLPWTTTKDGVDTESEIYQYTLGQMVKYAKPVVEFLVTQYNKDKDMEGYRKLIQDAKEVSLAQLTNNSSLFKAEVEAVQKKTPEEAIQYKVLSKDFEKAKKLIGDKNTSAKKVGEHTFYYFMEHEG